MRKKWTKTYPKDAKFLSLTTCLSGLNKYATSVLSTVGPGSTRHNKYQGGN